MTISKIRLVLVIPAFACFFGCQSRSVPPAPTQQVGAKPLSTPDEMTKAWRISPVTGEDLTKECSSNDASLQLVCTGYLVGALDMLDSIEATTDLLNLTCVPIEVTAPQMAKVIVKYGTDHPEDLHVQGAAFAMRAFGTAWPCNDDIK